MAFSPLFFCHFQLRTSISYANLLPVMLRHNLIPFRKRIESCHMHIYMRIIISKVRIYVFMCRYYRYEEKQFFFRYGNDSSAQLVF